MTPKLLLLATIGYSISLGLFFGWRQSLKSFSFWSVIGAALIEVGATEWDFSNGFSDTLLKQLLIIFGLGIPIFMAARHASMWRAACKAPANVIKRKGSFSVYAIHGVTLINLWLPGIGIIATGLAMLYAKNSAKAAMPQLIDSSWFQAYWSLLLIAAYLLSTMPIGIYLSSVVIFYGASKILIGLAVITAGYEYRYCNSPSLLTRLGKTLGKKRLTKANEGL